MCKEGFKYRDRDTERFCGVAFMHPKIEGNVGTAMRTASCLNIVDFFMVIGERYNRVRSDTVYSSYRHPTFTSDDFEMFQRQIPVHCELIAIEQSNTATPLETFIHPKRALYLFGAEDEGIPTKVLSTIKKVVCLPSPLGISMNLSSCASIVLWDRYIKQATREFQHECE